MELQKETMEVLDLTANPGFSVKENIIMTVNQAAAGFMIQPGTDVRTLLLTGAQEYDRFEGGVLCLTLKLNSGEIGATVLRTENGDLFLLEPEYASESLKAMALASVQLREPLTSAMSDMAQLLTQDSGAETEALRRLNRALYQMHRLISNMSDAAHWQRNAWMEVRNMRNLFHEIFAKARAALEKSGVTLSIQELEEEVYTCADAAQLERAVLNMLSNAVKFSPKGSTIHASLKRQGRMLLLSIRDEGCGISPKIQGTVFNRYLRQPASEESHFGLGLGMELIRCTATAHGGTVLIDHPEGVGTRVTMTIAIQDPEGTALHSPVLRVDYAGERDHLLVELSDILPPELY